MSIETQFIALLRQEIELQRAKAVSRIVEGKLDQRDYGYSCGYLRALDDLVRDRAKDQQPGIIDQILEDMRKE